MSDPINPLSNYTSYNYQQILVVTDTTETAERLSKSNEFLDYTRSQDASRENTPAHPYAKYDTYKINLGEGRTGSYVILINGTQDAEFIISKVHWYNSVVAPAGGEGNHYSTFNVGGEMEISEPQGIRFMNVLSEVSDRLGSDPSGLIFLLKTVFIGYRSPTYEDSGFSDPITNIRPNILKLVDLNGSFDVAGGSYKVEFAGINHGATKEQHIRFGADRIKIDMAKPDEGCQANTLSGALCRLQNKIGIIYDEYYNSIKKQIEDTLDEDGNKLKFTGRKVQYIIMAEDVLNNPEYLVTDFKDAATNTGETGKAGMIDLSLEPTVEAAILAIAKRCPKVQEDLIVGDGISSKKTRYILKVSTTIQSTDTEYNMIYKLRRVIESREDILAILSNRTSDDSDDLNIKIKENLFTLEYMYTGKNIDIIDFDLKMDMGLVLFTNLATVDNIPSSKELVDGVSPPNMTAKGRPVAVVATSNGRIRQGTPIFLSTRVKKETLPHSTNPKRAMDFQELINRHAALENMLAVVKIQGNPGLLNTVNKTPSEIVNTQDPTTTESTTAQLEKVEGETSGAEVDSNKLKVIHGEQDPFPRWETIPAIVQIKIQMPSVFYGGAQSTNDFAEPFWYRGYFYCFAIEQFFEGGEFTQTLHLVSIPKNSPEENTQKDKSQTDQAEQTAAANQTNNVPGSGTSTGDSSVGPPSQSTGNTPANTPDEMTVQQYQKANANT